MNSPNKKLNFPPLEDIIDLLTDKMADKLADRLSKVIAREPSEDTILFSEYNNYPPMLRVSDVQKILGIGLNQAYILVKKADFPKIMSGRSILIPRDPFFKWINNKS